MLGNFDIKIFGLASLAVLVGIATVLYLIQAVINQTLNLPNDALLRELMQRVGIPNWKVLQAKSGLRQAVLFQLRDSSDAVNLKLSEVKQVAETLNLPILEFLERLKLLPANPELEAMSQECLKLQQQLQQIVSEKEAMHQEGLRVHEELQQQRNTLTDEFRSSTFEQLQTLLTNYPSIHQMVRLKPELPVKNLLSMFTPLDNLLQEWGYETIGKPWEQVPYNPQIHQPDAADITEGELVYIRFVGYKHQEHILCPAKVSRTLPDEGDGEMGG